MSRWIVVLFSFCFLLSFDVNAKINPENQPDIESADGRVPESFSKGKGFPKAKAGVFEAEGFGEEAVDIESKRMPAQEKKKGNDVSEEVSSSDQGSKKAETKTDTSNAKDNENKEVNSTGADASANKALEEKDKLQFQRRVDIFYQGRVRFKNGASMWAVEDSAFGEPKLEVRAPDFLEAKAQEVEVRVFTNYFPYIRGWELTVYKREGLKPLEEIQKIKGDSKDLYSIKFKITDEMKVQEGDVLFYDLRVFGDKDLSDVTTLKKISFEERIEPGVSAESDANAEDSTLKSIWGQNSLLSQNIQLRGSRVRIVGASFPRNYTVTYRNQNLAVDQNGKFVIEEHFPVGNHKIAVEVTDVQAKETFTVPFEVEITGKYLFMVGLADFRFGQNFLSEKVSGLSASDGYNDSFLDGRLAFYLKGKIKGKYLITAQLDTTEGPVEDMFKGLHQKNSEALFRRLDPDRYYPVYGDNSNTFQDTPTQGKMYVKIEVDKSHALWGSFNSEINDTLFAQYNRTLYGASVVHKSMKQTKWGDNKTEVRAFLSEPQTLFGHNEFLATGGRVYTLRHNDVVQGSEKLVIEIRDPDSGLLKSSVILKPYTDYEFDYLAGRIVLNQALTTFVLADENSGIDRDSLSQSRYYLVADYEYNDSVSALSDITFGGRVNKWFNDNFSVGGTYVKESRDITDYNLQGIDATYKIGRESYLRVEGARSESEQSQSNFVSNNGGITFDQKPFVSNPGESAFAWGLEGQVFLNDFMETEHEGILRTWYRDSEQGFSTARRQVGNDLVEYGYDLELKFNNRDVVKSKVTRNETSSTRTDSTYIVSYGRKLRKGHKLSGEYNFVETKDTSTTTNDSAHLLGFKYSHRLKPQWEVYTRAQTSLNEKGNYQENDKVSVGTKFRMGQKWEGSGEYGTGDRGDTALVGVGYNITTRHKIYTNFDQSIDTTSGSEASGMTFGQKVRFDNNFSGYTENQFTETADQAGINQLYGLDYRLDRLWTMGLSFQQGAIEEESTGLLTEKEAVSLSAVYNKENKLLFSSKASYVKNTGGDNFDQIILTNSINYRASRATSIFLEGDYSETKNDLLATPLARYIEGNFGFAYRPVTNDRWNIFGKYTYLYDLDSQAQANARNDQRVNIFSLEGSYDLNRRWELGSRVAYKVGSERVVRGVGPWIDTSLTFAQLRARYHLIKKWDALIEYRMVNVEESKDLQNGALLGLDYHLGGNLKLGVGFNFTNFNDDLTNFNFNSYGWFINIVGKL